MYFNNELLNFSKFNVPSVSVGKNECGCTYLTVGKDKSYHRNNCVFYCGKSNVEKVKKGYYGSGSNMLKRYKSADRKSGRCKTFILSTHYYICPSDILKNEEGFLIHSLKDRVGKRCLNKSKLDAKKQYRFDSLREYVKDRIYETKISNGENVSIDDIEEEVKSRINKVSVWGRRKNYPSICGNGFNGLNSDLYKTHWDSMDLLLYQYVVNQNTMKDKIIEIRDFINSKKINIAHA